MLGLMNSCAAISRLVCPCAARREICASCGVSWSSVSHGPFAGALAGRLQLDPRALGERLHPEVGEEVVGDPQLLARVKASALASQPLAVEQMRPREVQTKARRLRDGRSPRGRASRLLRLDEGAPASALRRPVPTGCRWRGSIRSARSRASCGTLASTAAAGGLDQLDRREGREPQLMWIRRRPARPRRRRPRSAPGRCRARRSPIATP